MADKIYRKMFFAFCLVSPLVLLANEEAGAVHHEPSVLDLRWPLFNFLVLAVGFVFLTKNKISQMFTKYSDDVEKLINYAQEKDREAQIKLEMFQRKLETLEQQKQKIEQETRQDLEKYEAQTQIEFKNETNRIIRDAESKLDNEKKMVLLQLYSELANKVVENTKSKFTKNKDLKDKATEKILSQIR